MRNVTAVIAFLALAGMGLPVARGQDSVDPKGSYPDMRKGNLFPLHSGTLEIYFEPGDYRGGSRQAQDARRPRCRIYDSGGQFIKEMVDQSSSSGVFTASLSPGRYLVEFITPPVRRLPFWVTIVGDRPVIVDVSRLGTEGPRAVEAPKPPVEGPEPPAVNP